MKRKEPMRTNSVANDWMTVTQAHEAAQAAGVHITRWGIQKWVERYEGLAKKVGGRWHVNAQALNSIIDGEEPRRKEMANGSE